jgi:hypothetical protein
MQKLKQWVFSYNFIFIVFALGAIAVSCQRYFPAHTFEGKFTFYNNYILFKSSIHHLLEHKDMYTGYTGEGAYDLYKYSPTFAVFMLPYAYLPDLAGLILWNLTNVLLVFVAIKRLPFAEDRKNKLMLWFVFAELLLSAQSSQSNGLIAALFLLTYTAFERNNLFAAALFTGIAICIKPYAGIIGILFLFYPGKLKFIRNGFGAGIALLLLPLLLTSFANLQNQYLSWFSMMSQDYSDSTGLSVMALVNTFSGTIIDKKIVMLAGTLLTFSVLFFFSKFKEPMFRALFVALLMLWVVIFNHKSESPTFIIPVAGVGLWFFSRPYSNLNLILLLTVLVFTELSPSDIFPPYVRQHIFAPIHIKVIPCFLVWATILTTFYSGKGKKQA